MRFLLLASLIMLPLLLCASEEEDYYSASLRVSSAFAGMQDYYFKTHTNGTTKGWWFACGQSDGICAPGDPDPANPVPDLSLWYLRVSLRERHHVPQLLPLVERPHAGALANIGIATNDTQSYAGVAASMLKWAPFNTTYSTSTPIDSIQTTFFGSSLPTRKYLSGSERKSTWMPRRSCTSTCGCVGWCRRKGSAAGWCGACTWYAGTGTAKNRLYLSPPNAAGLGAARPGARRD
jgi:hypothetical protein